MQKVIDKCFTISAPIDNVCIQNAKDFLTKNFDSTYSIPPHITISLTPLPHYNLDKAAREISLYLRKLTSIKTKVLSLEVDRYSSFFYLKVLSNEIAIIHKDITSLLEKYREGFIRVKDSIRLVNGYYDSNQADHIKQFGYLRVFDNYIPHITIGKIVKESGDINQIQSQLEDILREVMYNDFHINQVLAIYHSDSYNQGDLKTIWMKEFLLSPRI